MCMPVWNREQSFVSTTLDIHDYENCAGQSSQTHTENLTHYTERTPVCAHCSMDPLDSELQRTQLLLSLVSITADTVALTVTCILICS